MATDPSLNAGISVNQLILNAARIAGGRSDNQPLTGEQTNTALFLLNNTLAEWGENGIYVFFVSNYEFPSVADKLDYTIGNSTAFDLNTNPFNVIYSLTFNQGDITYTCKYITPKRFNSIVLKSITTFSYVFTFEVKNDFTLLRMFPRTQGGTVVKLVGKQRFTNFNLFDDLSNFPRYANNAMMYYLADLLSDTYGWEPADSLPSKLEKYMALMRTNNKNDFEIETDEPFMQFLPFGGRSNSYYG
jgi:hypothetical protein